LLLLLVVVERDNDDDDDDNDDYGDDEGLVAFVTRFLLSLLLLEYDNEVPDRQ
jgi:hypothetical protein